MGREIRRVPPNWQHPTWTADDAKYRDLVEKPRPCFDETFSDAASKWKNEFKRWEDGSHEDLERSPELREQYEFWEWHEPPDPETHRPMFTAEPTWWQVYETVSEGTPVTPPFETQQALAEYLIANGDFWCQKSGENPPTREQAEAFVRVGFGLTFLLENGDLKDSYQAAPTFSTETGGTTQ